MKINSISSTDFNGVNIKAANNKTQEYLYNYILDITNKYKLPACFYSEEINLPTVTKDIIKRLKELNIKYSVY